MQYGNSPVFSVQVLGTSPETEKLGLEVAVAVAVDVGGREVAVGVSCKISATRVAVGGNGVLVFVGIAVGFGVGVAVNDFASRVWVI